MKKTSGGRRLAFLTGALLVVLLGIGVWVGHEQIRFWWLFESLGRNEQGYREFRHRETGIVFVKLPGTTFLMGTGGKEFVEVAHDVTLSPFLIAKYEVSQAIWRRGTSSNPSRFQGDSFPVENVTWEEASRFCERYGFCLPTEAQWEYACRADTSTEYAFGDELKPEQANFKIWSSRGGGRPVVTHGGSTLAVTSFEPNGFGLYNMHGNVWEWCADVSDPKFYLKRQAREMDPLAASGSKYRVVRGGGCGTDVRSCRSANRGRSRPSGDDRLHIGFRPVFRP